MPLLPERLGGKMDAVTPTHDEELWISTGLSRFDKDWKNKKVHWSKLLTKLSTAVRTPETFAQYKKMSRTEKDSRKDIGGFVGGILEGGKRSSTTVKSRSMISLDLDFAPAEFFEDYQMTADYAVACYSTHSHSKASPRYRLVIPLSRQVSPDEYEAAARMLASHIGMDYMDPSTFQPSRLMFWPSCSTDADYFFDYIDGEFLDVDKLLGEYDDWHDVSQWPVSPREAKLHKSSAKKQADPTAKHGIVGAFCRSYDVPAAIAEFLPDVYTPTDKEDRYTYAAGSTTAGLVIYEDGKFAYSNHGTDPAGGQLCNAFDLVRIHKYGERDEDAKPDTPANRLPSFVAMNELAMNDEQVKRELYLDQHVGVDEFDDDGDEPIETDKSKKKADKLLSADKIAPKLDVNSKGAIVKSVVNCRFIFEHDKALAGISQNELSHMITVVPDYPVPWHKAEGSSWSDTDDAELYTYIATTYAEFPRKTVEEQKLRLASRHAYHPIKDYLKALPEWDGTKRADSLLIDYLGAPDNIYVREATSILLLTAVQRLYEPGAKMDSMLVISGDPGIGKSTLISRLAGGWFSDSLSFDDMRDPKIAGERIQGKWIIEIPEMKGLKKMDVESVKKFLSQQSDHYRPAYGHNPVDRKRQCVFFGTVNDSSGYLKDPTGNRRFWPVRVSGKGVCKAWHMTEETRSQIWAEVFKWYNDGRRCGDLSPEAKAIAEKEQREAMEQDDREGLIIEYLNRKVPADWNKRTLQQRRDFLDKEGSSLAGDDEEGTMIRDRISNIEIWCECLGKSRTSIQKRDSYELAEIMARLGWSKLPKQERRGEYGPQYVYMRPEREM